MSSVRFGMGSTGLAVGVLFVPTAASAHADGGPHLHFMGGFLHPLSGLDHLLAMTAVGLFASCLGGRSLWTVPLSFLTLMVAGGLIGAEGMALPFVEPALALSVAVFGFAIFTCKQWTALAAMTLAGLFAVFHGYAHGTEIPLNAVGVPYLLGIAVATALLHLIGIAIGLKGQRVAIPGSMETARLGGFIFSFAGGGLLLSIW